jgi:hypothetical protein
MRNRLELVRRERGGGGGRTKRSWIEFLVDGSSLHDAIEPGDFIGCLGWSEQHFEASLLRQLLHSEGGNALAQRVMIYVCPECAELECGAVTVAVKREGNDVVWERFAFENSYDAEVIKTYDHIGPFRFSGEQYQQTLGRRLREIGT